MWTLEMVTPWFPVWLMPVKNAERYRFRSFLVSIIKNANHPQKNVMKLTNFKQEDKKKRKAEQKKLHVKGKKKAEKAITSHSMNTFSRRHFLE